MLETSPQKFGRYEVRAELGSGAMGVVYRAFDPVISREVAVKTIKKSLDLPATKRQEYLERFKREAQSAGRLSNHPNIVPVFDVGQEGDLPYIVMAYVEGDSLDRLRRKGKLDATALDALTAEICSALGHAHRNGIIHRDVKPANILMTARGAMLTDFGIARMDDSELTRAGTFLGSPSYMSPEQVKGGELGGTSDLFSMAVILYMLLTNEKPFRGEDTNEILYKIVHEKHIPASAYGHALNRWDDFFDKALAKTAAGRYSDAEQFYLAFNRTLEAKGDVAATASTLDSGEPLDAGSAAPADAPPAGEPAKPAGKVAQQPARERRVNPLHDRTFQKWDMKDQIPLRGRSGSGTDSGRLGRLLKKGSPGTNRRRGKESRLPPAFWAALVAVTLALAFVVVQMWPSTPATAPAAAPALKKGKDAKDTRDVKTETSKPKRARP